MVVGGFDVGGFDVGGGDVDEPPPPHEAIPMTLEIKIEYLKQFILCPAYYVEREPAQFSAAWCSVCTRRDAAKSSNVLHMGQGGELFSGARHLHVLSKGHGIVSHYVGHDQ
jgi:hypothetical protein